MLERLRNTSIFSFPPKEYFPDIKDGISLNLDFEAYPDLAIGVVSLSREPITKLTSFLSATPKFKEKITFSKINHKYAARYVLDLYPAIAALWIDEMSTGVFPRDIIGMLSDSLEYFYRRDWRTSIVLSSISAEMILAEMYEEAFQRPAPVEPLGTLLDKLMKKGELAEEMKASCRRVTQMRKSAVHRGLAPPTIREASLALYGAIQLAFCHYL